MQNQGSPNRLGFGVNPYDSMAKETSPPRRNTSHSRRFSQFQGYRQAGVTPERINRASDAVTPERYPTINEALHKSVDLGNYNTANVTR